MILSFINIRKVPREVLKTSGFALGFQHFPRDPANVNEWKIMFDTSIERMIGHNFYQCKMKVQCFFNKYKIIIWKAQGVPQ